MPGFEPRIFRPQSERAAELRHIPSTARPSPTCRHRTDLGVRETAQGKDRTRRAPGPKPGWGHQLPRPGCPGRGAQRRRAGDLMPSTVEFSIIGPAGRSRGRAGVTGFEPATCGFGDRRATSCATPLCSCRPRPETPPYPGPGGRRVRACEVSRYLRHLPRLWIDSFAARSTGRPDLGMTW
jgi:hypothetical protein